MYVRGVIAEQVSIRGSVGRNALSEIHLSSLSDL